MLTTQQANQSSIDSLRDVEFKVFSQFGDDGIIQWLIRQLPIANRTFIEFGVSNYRESNTRFLLMNSNWQGFVMDGSEKRVREIRSSEYYWKYDLVAKSAFVNADNVNDLINESGFEHDVGLLHIDVDGNDYWLWKAIDRVSPSIVIVEYNSILDAMGPVTIPYDASFLRRKTHYSNLYFGTSLSALAHLASDKGYALIGSNSAGNNAYFVRRDLLNSKVREVAADKAFVESRFRESRDANNQLSFKRGSERLKILRGLPLFNVATGETVTI